MEKKRNIFQWYSDYKKIKNKNSILDKLYEFNSINSKQFNHWLCHLLIILVV